MKKSNTIIRILIGLILIALMIDIILIWKNKKEQKESLNISEVNNEENKEQEVSKDVEGYTRETRVIIISLYHLLLIQTITLNILPLFYSFWFCP